MSRAFCCRVYNELDDALPPGYSINHPDLGTASAYNPAWNVIPQNTLSINWIVKDSDTEMEVVDSTLGLATEE